MIIVTGATGGLTGATVDHLLERVPTDDVVLAVRDPTKAQRFADRGVAVRRGDYADPESLKGAFEGAEQVLLVSSSDPGADAVSLHRAAIDAAVSTWLAGPWRETGVITVPADGPVSWTAREDAAEAAAVILASDGGYDGPTTITAGTAPTFAEVAAIASELTGRTIGLAVMDQDETSSAANRGPSATCSPDRRKETRRCATRGEEADQRHCSGAVRVGAWRRPWGVVLAAGRNPVARRGS